ncbi:MAG: hypothetical protein JSR97_12565 [Verrucomicrobia bacterium]|nr:hypothetical protein [Verrucomicrobiota bacterium]
MKIQNVLCGEYFASYITDTKKLMYNSLNGIADTGLNNIVSGCGGQYANIVLDSAGVARIVGFRQANGNFINTIPGTGWEQVYACYQAYFLVKAGKLYAYGKDKLNINGGADITTPKALNSMVKFTKFDSSSSSQDGYMEISGLAENGTVWQWKTGQGLNAVQVTFTGNIARDITYVGDRAFVVETATDLFARGVTKPEFVGLAWNQTTFVSIKSQYTSAGAVFPTKQLIGSSNTLHIIDQNDNLYGQGEQAQGEVGAGAAYDYSISKNFVWSWMLTKYQPVIKVTAEPYVGTTTRVDKFKKVFTGNTVAFYLYALDINDNLYSWGRNKAMVLGNGVTLNSDNESAQPNYLDMASPSYVTPLTQTWQVIPLNVNVQPPRIPQAAPAPEVVVPPTPTPFKRAVIRLIYNDGSSQEVGG